MGGAKAPRWGDFKLRAALARGGGRLLDATRVADYPQQKQLLPRTNKDQEPTELQTYCKTHFGQLIEEQARILAAKTLDRPSRAVAYCMAALAEADESGADPRPMALAAYCRRSLPQLLQQQAEMKEVLAAADHKREMERREMALRE